MQDKTKRIITISVLVAMILSMVVYFIFRKPSVPEDISNIRTGSSGGVLPGSGDVDISGAEGLGSTGEEVVEIAGEKFGAKLFQLVPNAVAGAAFVENAITASSSVRYVERSTGHIYEIDPSSEEKERKRISNTTILKVFETSWDPNGKSIVMRYIEDGENPSVIRTFSASFIDGKVEGTFLPQDLDRVVLSPQGDKIFYLQNGGFIVDLENKNKKTIFPTPFNNFNIEWTRSNVLTLTSKPSGLFNGLMYFVNPTTGSFKKILDGVNGLVTKTSLDGKKVLYNESSVRGFVAKIYDVETKSSQPLGLSILVDKCVWSSKITEVVYCGMLSQMPVGTYPDIWYQGKIAFNDSIWVIDTGTGATLQLVGETDLDIINPFLSANENYFIFTDKNDNSLWTLDISEFF